MRSLRGGAGQYRGQHFCLDSATAPSDGGGAHLYPLPDRGLRHRRGVAAANPKLGGVPRTARAAITRGWLPRQTVGSILHRTVDLVRCRLGGSVQQPTSAGP